MKPAAIAFRFLHYRFAGLFFALLSIAVFFGAAGPTCRAGEAANRSSDAVVADRYQPIGAWTGQLLPPSPDRRDPSGGVPFRVENSPMPELIGKIIWLRWNMAMPWDQWFQTLKFDVAIDPARLKKAREAGLNPPDSINGWKAVSPLESLACARPGEMTVLLKNPEFQGDVLLINEEPVQICGEEMGLVRFIVPGDGDTYAAVHFDQGTGDFTGPTETVWMPRTHFSRSNTPIARSSTVEIEKSSLNRDGWYIYGRREQGVFKVEALEPRAMMRLTADRTVNGREPVKEYISHEHFADLAYGMTRVTELVPDRDHDWREGDKGLLIHLFGWRSHPDEKPGAGIPGVITGHFAFGIAEVSRCPLSGEPRWDLEYRQAYAHNREGIVAGSMKWHCYSGSLNRGWMYTIPISDTIVHIPELEPYDFNGWEVQPWKGLNRQLEKMQAVYRTGAGSGISSVKPDLSCVQDSHCALYSALRTFEETIAKTGKVKEWLTAMGPESDEAKRYLRLLLLVRKVKHLITAFGIAQGNWREFFRNPLGTRDPNAVESLVNALLSKNSVFPRKGNDNLLHIAAEMGYPCWSILTSQIGGVIPNLTPQAPTSTTVR